MEQNAMAGDCHQNDFMSSKAFSDRQEEITKVGDRSTSLKRKKLLSFDSIENENNISKKSKIDDESFIGMSKSSDDVKAIALESCIYKQEEFNTAEKLCVTEQKGLMCVTEQKGLMCVTEQKELIIAEKQESCVTTEQVLPIKEKEGLDITENKGLDVNEILTSVESNETDDESNETDDESNETDDDNTNEPGPINRPEAVKFPKLYRLLREDENITKGLKPKNRNANMSVAEHVACGSNGGRSQYISTCSNIHSVKRFRNLKLKSRQYRNGTKDIVEIDVNKLPNNVRIIDLTEESLRQQHEGDESRAIISKFHQHAHEFDEVLLEGTVPSYCLVTASL